MRAVMRMPLQCRAPGLASASTPCCRRRSARAAATTAAARTRDAVARGDADINRCPPGGDAVIATLAALAGRAPQAARSARAARPGRSLVAVIDEATCIGCTLCIEACPVDAIIGAAKRMQRSLPALCTRMRAVRRALPGRLHRDGRRRDATWTREDARAARVRHDARDAPARAQRAHRQAQARSRRRATSATATAGRGRRGAPRARARGARARSTCRHASAFARCAALLLLPASIVMTHTADATPTSRRSSTSCWDFDKPDGIARRAFAPSSRKYPADSREALEIATQIARTQSLRASSPTPTATLDAIVPKLDDGAGARAASATCWSAAARSIRAATRGARCRCFSEALDARRARHAAWRRLLRVDALHMLGIAAPADERLDWNLKALARRREARDRPARARLARVALQQHRLDLLRARRSRRRRSTTGRRRCRCARRGQRRRDRASRSGRSRAAIARIGQLDDAEDDPAALVGGDSKRPASPTATCTRSWRRSRSRAATRRRGAAWAAKAHALLKDDGYLGERSRAPRAPCRRSPARQRASRESRRSAARSSSACARPIPNPTTELEYATPFELLVAVVLSAQATDKSVNKATARLFPVANTPAAIAKLGVEGLMPYISSIGLFRNKAKNVVALSRDPAARARRRGARGPRGAGSAARRRPQDRQRRAEHRVRPADDRRRHAHLPRRQPHRTSRRARTSSRSSAGSMKFVPDEFKLRRASLADPARALRLRRAHAEVPGVHHPRPVRVPAQDDPRPAPYARRCS